MSSKNEELLIRENEQLKEEIRRLQGLLISKQDGSFASSDVQPRKPQLKILEQLKHVVPPSRSSSSSGGQTDSDSENNLETTSGLRIQPLFDEYVSLRSIPSKVLTASIPLKEWTNNRSGSFCLFLF